MLKLFWSVLQCRRMWWGIAATALLAPALWLLGQSGWPDREDSCVERDNCYCESIGDGNIRQPINTWSAFAFCAVGLWMMGICCLDSKKPHHERPARNVMANGSAYAWLFAWVVWWMGPASMLYHASLRFWAGFLDQGSIVWLFAFVLLFNAQRLWRRPRFFSDFLILFVTAATALSGTFLLVNWHHLHVGMTGLSDVLLGVPGISALTLTIAGWSGKRAPVRFGEVTSKATYLFPMFIVFALIAWTFSQKDGPLCDPHGLQGHAVWHLLSALGVGAGFWAWRKHPRGLHQVGGSLRPGRRP